MSPEDEYSQIKKAVEAAGFFADFQPIKSPGDRIIFASQKHDYGLDGVSFWVARR